MELRLIASLLLVATLAGCAGNTLRPEAFKNPKKMALVSVVGVTEGLATSSDDDAQLLAATVTTSMNEMERSRHLRLAPEASVLGSRGFKAIKDEGPGMFQDLAKGYKRFDPKKESANLKQLARELQVDGFVGVMVHYGTKKAGLAVGGFLPAPIPVSVGRVKASVMYTVYAFDANGDIFWQDTAQLVSDDAITTAMGVGQYKALHPKLITLTKAACRQLVANLDQRLGAK